MKWMESMAWNQTLVKEQEAEVKQAVEHLRGCLYWRYLIPALA
jgi:hypothetical protein